MKNPPSSARHHSPRLVQGGYAFNVDCCGIDTFHFRTREEKLTWFGWQINRDRCAVAAAYRLEINLSINLNNHCCSETGDHFCGGHMRFWEEEASSSKSKFALLSDNPCHTSRPVLSTAWIGVGTENAKLFLIKIISHTRNQMMRLSDV